jgi:hypothetical protein
MNEPPKKKGGLYQTALHNVELTRAYRFSSKTQLVSRRKQRRSCLACGSTVTNRNLGGHNGRSALSSNLWCERCADFPQQLVLSLWRAAE